jgi:hypothetical protein
MKREMPHDIPQAIVIYSAVTAIAIRAAGRWPL